MRNSSYFDFSVSCRIDNGMILSIHRCYLFSLIPTLLKRFLHLLTPIASFTLSIIVLRGASDFCRLHSLTPTGYFCPEYQSVAWCKQFLPLTLAYTYSRRVTVRRVQASVSDKNRLHSLLHCVSR